MNIQPESQAQQDDLADVRKELDKEKNRHLRTLADFDNYRKRVERDAQAVSTRGKKDLIRALLPVLDNLERALAQVQDQETRQGLQMVCRQMADVLGQHGLDLIESVGKPFDPGEHEGIGYVESEDCPPGHVAGELSRGYRFGGELLRPAIVRVSKKSR